MSDEKTNENDPMEFVKKQWKAMGIDPTQMLQYMNNAMEMQKNVQEQVQKSLDENAILKNFMNLQGGQSSHDMLNLFDDAPQIKEDTDLTLSQVKAVLCGANVAYNSSQYTNTLHTFIPVDDILSGLENAWDVRNREELLETLGRLEQTGHKIYFDMIWGTLRTLPKAEWRNALKSLEHQAMTMENIAPERLHDFAANLLNGYSSLLASGCFATMKDPDILAWDLSRAINLCRYGFDVEFLNREEALERIERYAAKMFATYDSWKSLSEGYLVGFTMWNGHPDSIQERLDQHNTLVTHEKSLWNKISWPG